jgi:hypothetical protein
MIYGVLAALAGLGSCHVGAAMGPTIIDAIGFLVLVADGNPFLSCIRREPDVSLPLVDHDAGGQSCRRFPAAGTRPTCPNLAPRQPEC